MRIVEKRGVFMVDKKRETHSNMDGPRDYPTKCSKPAREGQTSCDITDMWNLKKKKMIQMNLFTKHL